MCLLFTSLVFVVLMSCRPFMGNDPRNYQGRGATAVLHLFVTDSMGRHGDR